MIPESIRSLLQDRLNLSIQHIETVGGGSINRAAKIITNERKLFLKWNDQAPSDFFEKETLGLDLLRNAFTQLRIPGTILTESPTKNRPGFLLMEYIKEGPSGDAFEFGVQLAELHMHDGDQFGLFSDNYIGSLPQSNTRHTEWNDFFSEERIAPQLKMAVDSGKLDSANAKSWERLATRLDEIFPFADPSLLHGDLWSGNYLYNSSGRAVLIDPAVYYGHPEMDLAFSKMFGGFPGEFYSGYESVSPLEPGFNQRIPIYNLYPLLVHANLFGGSYIRQVTQTLKQF